MFQESAVEGSGSAIYVSMMMYLEIENTIFENNQINGVNGEGGAISTYASELYSKSYLYDRGYELLYDTYKGIRDQSEIETSDDDATREVPSIIVLLHNTLFENNRAEKGFAAIINVAENSLVSVVDSAFENNYSKGASNIRTLGAFYCHNCFFYKNVCEQSTSAIKSFTALQVSYKLI